MELKRYNQWSKENHSNLESFLLELGYNPEIEPYASMELEEGLEEWYTSTSHNEENIKKLKTKLNLILESKLSHFKQTHLAQCLQNIIK